VYEHDIWNPLKIADLVRSLIQSTVQLLFIRHERLVFFRFAVFSRLQSDANCLQQRRKARAIINGNALTILCEISGSNGGDYEEYSLLGYNTV
jgi:hypothetical protein